MLVKRVAIENVRSFLDREELKLDGPLSIIIGPNGGGKTNLLDIIVTVLRRHLYASMYAAQTQPADAPELYEFRANDVLTRMQFDRHSRGAERDQLVEIEIEVTQRDLDGMRAMQESAGQLIDRAKTKYMNVPLHEAATWKLDDLLPGTRIVYRVVNGKLETDGTSAQFLRFLQLFEIDSMLRDEYGFAPLATPLVYLPVTRTTSAFQTSVDLSGYNDFEIKRQSDAASSRSGTQIMSLAIGRLAQRYRLLLEHDKGTAKTDLRKDPNLIELTTLLRDLGYEWSLETINALKNRYDVRLSKQGSSFLVGAASSGERELLTYLFAIFSLNVRNALILVDEPELHLHPKWQRTLLQLFSTLAEKTGNQFLFATHSPMFVSPDSIQFVSRVFSREQRSHILRLDTAQLPEAKHLLSIINSQNNERLFFADEVILVEGVSDRIFFEALLDKFGRGRNGGPIIEVISVGGKGLFQAYAKVLHACQIEFSIVADLDYVEQVGTDAVKGLFRVDTKEIKSDVIENVKSADGKALVDAIERGVVNQDWTGATEIWEYIKSRRRALRSDIDETGRATLDTFIEEQRAKRLHILKRGALEDYLPPGHHSKDLDKLIRLLATDYWSVLPQDGQAELKTISEQLLGIGTAMPVAVAAVAPTALGN